MKINNEKKEQVRQMLLHGWFGHQVAETCGVSEATVNKIRKELKQDGHPVGYDR